MPVFLDTRGESVLGVGICDRCRRKFPLLQLHSDPNSPGLRVCVDDMDVFDPYRLPARQTEKINLPFVRPDVDLAIRPENVAVATGDFLLSEDGDIFATEGGDLLEWEVNELLTQGGFTVDTEGDQGLLL